MTAAVVAMSGMCIPDACRALSEHRIRPAMLRIAGGTGDANAGGPCPTTSVQESVNVA